MLRKILDWFGYAGLAFLVVGYYFYSLDSRWDGKAQMATYGGLALLLAFLIANFSRMRASLRTRTGRYGSNAVFTVLFMLGILILINFLNFRHHKRLDLTEGQLYALSGQSRKVVENLDADVRIIGFFQTESGRQQFDDLMKEYQYVSSRIDYETVDPQEKPSKVSQYEVQRDGQVVVVSGPKTEIVDDATEEKVTNALIKVTRKEEKTVYFLQGHGERALNDTAPEGFSAVREAIEKQNYRVETYNLAQQNKLPEKLAVLVSAGPKVNFFSNEVKLLEQYLDSGGKFLLLVDPQNDFEMEDFLSDYGLGLGQDVVIDRSGFGQLVGLGPSAPLVADYTDHPITKEMKGIMTFFPMSQSVTTTSSLKGFESRELLSTTPGSWGETNLKEDRAGFDEGEDREGPLYLAAVATREERSEGKEEERADEAVEEGETSEREGEEEDAGQIPQPEPRFVLFGDSDFASNAYFGLSANGDLFLMAISWLAEDKDLVAIRARDPSDRRINLTSSDLWKIFWGVVVFFPLFTLVTGVTVWLRRR